MRPNLQRLTICLLVCGGISVAHAQIRADSPPTVRLEDGILEGARSGPAQNAAAFLGVPYAAPPVGELRWKPTQPARKWNERPRQATQFGAACPQLPASWFPDIGWNEDCLYLNVWTPQLSASAKLPVLVYFHGGSNTQGYSQMTPLGPTLAPRGVVVVSANYRLGPFGFLALPALTAESRNHSSGNYGLLDQLQALRWVRENIAHFGGDPNRVTVMGQSAGAVDICLLMASPMAAGLFQGAIMESGDCQSVYNEDIRAPIPYNLISSTGEESGELLAKDLGVANGANGLQKLRSIPADDILKAWSQDRRVHFDAIVDGWVVPQQPAKVFAEGRQMHIPVLVGSNADEATVFGHGGPKTVEAYKKYLFEDTGKYSTEEFRAYPVASDSDVTPRYLQLQSDTFAYGAHSMAQAMTRAGQKA
jgi:para-nitrobenzyl esterase